MAQLRVVFLLTILCTCVKAFDVMHHEGVIRCTARYEFRQQMRARFPGCSELTKHNPICGEEIVVAFSQHPPYVWKNSTGVHGILPGMIKSALETCCYGCNNVTFIGPFEPLEKFTQNATLVIPVQTSKSNTIYFGHDFIRIADVQAVDFLGPPIKHDPDKMVNAILSSVFNTWPLFIISLLMAVVAGIGMWILDQNLNKHEFPDRFPRGPFEGFWWAVVSMTTVGYGDRSPKSTLARIFAMLWIFVGITLFSMYSASLTSALTSAVISSHEISLYDKTLGLLNTSTIGIEAAVQIGAKYKTYHTIEQIGQAFHDKEIEAVVLDSTVASDFIDDLIRKEGVADLALYERRTMNNICHGMLSFGTNMTRLFKSFYESNDDQRVMMFNAALPYKKQEVVPLSSSSTDANEFFTSKKMFLTSTITLIILTVLFLCAGIFMKFFKYRFSKDKTSIVDEVLMGDVSNEEAMVKLVNDLHQKLLERIKQSKQ